LPAKAAKGEAVRNLSLRNKGERALFPRSGREENSVGGSRKRERPSQGREGSEDGNGVPAARDCKRKSPGPRCSVFPA